MGNKRYKVQTDYATSPGETILESIKEMGISKSEFAKKLNISSKDLSDIIRGKVIIDVSIAKKLESIMGSSESFWLMLQKKHLDNIQDKSQISYRSVVDKANSIR